MSVVAAVGDTVEVTDDLDLGRCQVQLDHAVGSGDLQRVHLAGQDDPAPVDDHDVLAEILDEVQLVAGEDHRGTGGRPLAEDPAIVPMPIGSRPLNGSSSTSSSGSWTSAAPAGPAAGCPGTAPRPSSRSGPPGPRSTSEPFAASARRAGSGRAAAPGSSAVAATRILRVQPTFLRHVAEADPVVGSTAWPSPPICRGPDGQPEDGSASSWSCPRRSARGTRACGRVGR